MPINNHEQAFAIAENYFKENLLYVKFSRKISGLANSFIRTKAGLVKLLSAKNNEDVKFYGSKINLGQSDLSRVKLGITKNYKPIAVKISIDSILSLTAPTFFNNIKNEEKIAKNTGLSIISPVVRSKMFGRIAKYYLRGDEDFLLGSYITDEKAGKDIKVYQLQKYYPIELFSYIERKINSKKINLLESIDWSAQFLLEVCDLHAGISSANRKPIVHLDLKPENLMFDANKQIKLIDFGFAREDIDGKFLVNGVFHGTKLYVPSTHYGHLTCRQADFFAALLTIFIPKKDVLSLLKEVFEHLPDELKNLISPAPLKEMRKNWWEKCTENPFYTERSVLAAIILYKNILVENAAEANEIFRAQYKQLELNIARQEQLINDYRKERALKARQKVEPKVAANSFLQAKRARSVPAPSSPLAVPAIESRTLPGF
ncbi:MAG: hypothetical protein A3F18_08075 [Legionellales bacterium RIFCSPHIGHO2_12_FULL_37_14]|nr:MAG: hypothetical protein A3F18_08075 [Legionellales bacterium RIFCSPHIGHO2_12_FULL_37_14]